MNKANSGEEAGDQLTEAETSISVYPNPFNPNTTFKVALPAPAEVHLEVFNLLGQRVQTLHSGRLEAGKSEFRFEGGRLGSGIYFYRFTAGRVIQTGRILLLK